MGGIGSSTIPVISLSESLLSNSPPPSVAKPNPPTFPVKTDRHIPVIRPYFNESSFSSEKYLNPETSQTICFLNYVINISKWYFYVDTFPPNCLLTRTVTKHKLLLNVESR